MGMQAGIAPEHADDAPVASQALASGLELLDRRLAVGVQDLGAAGLSCAASETAAKAGAGMDVDIARVAKREPGMNPVEVMTSESQERMLAIVEPQHLDAVLELATRWEVRAMVVGRVTDSGRFRVINRRDSPCGSSGEVVTCGARRRQQPASSGRDNPQPDELPGQRRIAAVRQPAVSDESPQQREPGAGLHGAGRLYPDAGQRIGELATRN